MLITSSHSLGKYAAAQHKTPLYAQSPPANERGGKRDTDELDTGKMLYKQSRHDFAMVSDLDRQVSDNSVTAQLSQRQLCHSVARSS